MMTAKFPFLAASLLAVAGAAHATDLNYDFVQVDYVVVDIDDFSEDLSGVSIAGSFLVTEEVYLFGGYADLKTDRVGGVRLSSDGYSLGVGYRYGLSRQTDLNFGAAFERAKLSVSGIGIGSDSASDNGYSLRVGVRHLLAPQVELGVGAVYVDIGDDDDTSAYIGGLWHITDLVAVSANLGFGSDATTYSGGIRFKF